MSVDGTSAAAALLLKRLFDALLPPFCSFPFFFSWFCQCDILDSALFGNISGPPSEPLGSGPRFAAPSLRLQTSQSELE